MKHLTPRSTVLVALATVLAATSLSPVGAQQPVPAAAAARPPAAPRVRPPLFFREEWKETTETGDITVSQQFVANPNLELKLYGPGARGMMITGSAANPQNPTHVWNGMCSENCALTLRDRNNFVDLTGQAKARWETKVSGFQRIHPVVKLADGTLLVGDWADGTTNDWRETEFYFSEVRWIKLDPTRIVTVGAVVDNVDLSRVDEFGWTDLMNASGHGQGGWSDVGKIELYGKPVPR